MLARAFLPERRANASIGAFAGSRYTLYLDNPQWVKYAGLVVSNNYPSNYPCVVRIVGSESRSVVG